MTDEEAAKQAEEMNKKFHELKKKLPEILESHSEIKHLGEENGDIRIEYGGFTFFVMLSL